MAPPTPTGSGDGAIEGFGFDAGGDDTPPDAPSHAEPAPIVSTRGYSSYAEPAPIVSTPGYSSYAEQTSVARSTGGVGAIQAPRHHDNVAERPYENAEAPAPGSQRQRQQSPRSGRGVSRSRTVVKRLVSRAQTLSELADDANPTWDSQCGRRCIRWGCISGPGPYLVLLALLGLAVGLVCYFLFGTEVAINLGLTSFSLHNHPSALLGDGFSASGSSCRFEQECVEYKCGPPGSTRRGRRGSPDHPRGNGVHDPGVYAAATTTTTATTAAPGPHRLGVRAQQLAPTPTTAAEAFQWPGDVHGRAQAGGSSFGFPAPAAVLRALGATESKLRSWYGAAAAGGVDAMGVLARPDSLDGGAFSHGARQRRSSLPSFIITLVFHAQNGGSMLTPVNFQTMRRMEAQIQAFSRTRSAQSALIQSLSHYVYTDGYSSIVPPLMSEDDITAGFDYAASPPGGTAPEPNKPAAIGSDIEGFGGPGFVRTPPWTSEYILAQCTVFESSQNDAVLDAWITELDKYVTDAVVLVYVNDDMASYRLISYLIEDVTLAVYALLFVGLCMVVHTGSVFLTLIGILNVILAFPFAYLVYSEMLGFTELSILTPVTLLVIIGIAVDDVFVFVDTFKQTDPEQELKARMIQTLSTAARATLFTTITSAVAFAANALSEIEALRTFGVMTACVIGCNYLVLVILVPIGLSCWHRNFQAPEAACAAVCCFPCYRACAAIGRRREPAELRRDSVDAEWDDTGTALGMIRWRSSALAARPDNAPAPSRRSPTAAGSAFDPKMSWRHPDGPRTGNRFESLKWGQGTFKDAHSVQRFRPSLNRQRSTRGSVRRRRSGAGDFPEQSPDGAEAGAATRTDNPTLNQRVLWWVAQPMVRYQRYVIAGFAIMVCICLWQASLLQTADKPPSFVKDSTNLGRVQALESEIPGLAHYGKTHSIDDPTIRGNPLNPDNSTLESDGTVLTEEDRADPDIVTCGTASEYFDLGLSFVPTFSCDEQAPPRYLDAANACGAAVKSTSRPIQYGSVMSYQCNFEYCCAKFPTCSEFMGEGGSPALCSDVTQIANSGKTESFCSTKQCTTAECCKPNNCAADVASNDFSCDTRVTHLKDDPSDQDCAGLACTPDECCEANPTCSEATANDATTPCVASGFSVDAAAATTVCQTGICTADECCTPYPTCSEALASDAALCSAANEIVDSGKSGTKCSGPTCRASECCKPNNCAADVASNGFSCDAGVTHLKDDPSDQDCAGLACKPDECCEANPTCGAPETTSNEATICGPGKHLDDAQSAVRCSAGTCDTGECCAANPGCEASDCSTGFHLRPDLGTDFVCNGKTCTREQCCFENPECSSVACNATDVVADLTKVCAGAACIFDECCTPRTCSTVDIGTFCGAARTLLDPNALCSVGAACTKSECCALKASLACSDWQADEPGFCGEGFAFAPEQASTLCGTAGAPEPCTKETCCKALANPTCGGSTSLACSIGETKATSLDAVTCASLDGCTQDECCVSNGKCSDLLAQQPTVCSSNQELERANPSGRVCSAEECTPAECCRPMTCGDVASPKVLVFCSGDAKFTEDLSLVCATLNCEAAKCCIPPKTVELNLADLDCAALENEKEIMAYKVELVKQIIANSDDTLTAADIEFTLCDVEGTVAPLRRDRSRVRRDKIVIKISGDKLDEAGADQLENKLGNITDALIQDALSTAPTTTASTTTRTTATATAVATTITATSRTQTTRDNDGTTTVPLGSELDAARRSANERVKLVFGLAHPFVDRSRGSSTSFFEETDRYRPHYDPNFNQGPASSPDTAFTPIGGSQTPIGLVRNDVFAQARDICLRVANNTALVLPGQEPLCEAVSYESVAARYRGCESSSAPDSEAAFFVTFFKSTYRSQSSSAEIEDYYDAFEAFLSTERDAFPLAGAVQHHGDSYERAVTENSAILGAIWGVVASVLLCFVSVVLFKAQAVIAVTIVSIVLINIVFVVAIFHWTGFTLGGIEAVSLSILVGTCVDYCIHLLEGFLEAGHLDAGGGDGDLGELSSAARSIKRGDRVVQAMTTVGVPVMWSAITTAGCSFFLTFANLSLFSRFGEILMINTVVSILLALTLLASLLAVCGPLNYRGSVKRSAIGVLALLATFALLALFMYILAKAGTRVKQADGTYLF